MSRSHVTRHSIVWVLALTLTMAGLSFASTPAYAADDGHITGTVTGTVADAGDVALEGVQVTAFRDDGEGWVDVAFDYTDSDGNYDIGDLPTGTYRLQFYDDSDAGYLIEFYDNADSVDTATDVEVITGTTTAGKNAQLTTPGHITGTVTGTVEGDDDVELDNVGITAFRDDGDGWVDVGYGGTNGDGSYDLSGLPTGTYRLQFYDNSDAGYLTEFYDNADSVDTATDVEVITGTTTAGKNAQLTTPGHITGTVTGTIEGDDDALLEDVQVTAFRDDGDGWVDVASDYTDTDGNYDIGDLPTGTYRLQFYDDSDAGYLIEFYDNADSVDTATDVEVITGTTTAGKNAQLTTPGHITGTVTGTIEGDDDALLEDVQVTAFRDDGDGWVDVAYDYTDSDGNYDIGDLPTGTYRLQFYDDSDAGYLIEFYDNATSLEAATDVEVTTGATAAGKDAQLTTPGHITGTVTGTIEGDDDALLEDVQVTAFRDDGDGWTDVAYATTDDQGRYDLGDLPTGTYRLQFYDDSDAGYLIEFYDNATSLEAATDVEVTTGATAAGKDAQLTTPGHITGTVTGTIEGDDDALLEGIQVIAFRDDGDGWTDVAYATTDDQGRYDLGDLATGTYRLRFEDDDDSEAGYIREFYDDADSVETATDIDVETGKTVTGIDALLTTYGHITGTVTGTADVELGDLGVTAFRDDGDGWVDVKYTTTDDQGHYDMAGLPTGTYRLQFYDNSDAGYLTEFYDNTDSVETATDIDVETGKTITGIDAQLTTPSHITGTVTGTVPDADDAELDDIGVSAFRDDGDGWVDVKYTTTDDQGHYDMAGLPTGTYRLQFYDNSDAGYLTEFYDNTDSVETATDIDVETGKTITGIDAQLTTPSHITGTVTGTVPDADDAELDDIGVSAFRDDGDGWAEIGYTTTDGDGGYDMAGLPTGTYRLQFYDNSDAGYLTEFYDNTDSVETATDIDVETGKTITGIDAQLTRPVVTNTATPTITGTARVGSMLSATTGTWDPADGLTFTYRWLIAGTPVTGANSATYVPTPSDLAKTIQVEVTAHASGHAPGTATSAATAAVTAAPTPVVTNTATPTITGTARVGSMLSATTGTWDPADGLTFTYRWLIAGTPVTGANSATYVPTPGDLAKTIQVEVTAHAAGHDPGTASSNPASVRKGILKTIKKPKVTGKVKKRATLKVSAGRWSPAKVKVSYTWFAGNRAILKATGNKLRLTGKVAKAVTGKTITVRVRVSAAGYATVTMKVKVRGKLKRARAAFS